MSKKCYTFAMTFMAANEEMAELVVKTISSAEGFLAVHPEEPYVMPVFDTLEHAINGRDIANEVGQIVADNIMNAEMGDDGKTLLVTTAAWGPAAEGGTNE